MIHTLILILVACIATALIALLVGLPDETKTKIVSAIAIAFVPLAGLLLFAFPAITILTLLAFAASPFVTYFIFRKDMKPSLKVTEEDAYGFAAPTKARNYVALWGIIVGGLINIITKGKNPIYKPVEVSQYITDPSNYSAESITLQQRKDYINERILILASIIKNAGWRSAMFRHFIELPQHETLKSTVAGKQITLRLTKIVVY